MNSTLRAALWMTGAIASFTSMAVAGRELAGVLDTFEIMTYRSLVGIIIVCLWLTLMRRWPMVSARHLGLHGLRNVAHFTGQNLWFFAVSATPLALVFALEFTTPLWVVVLAPLFLGERLTRTRLACAGLGFVGILIVARPGSIPLTPGVLAAAGCAIFFALTMVFTKRLTRQTNIASILFWLTVMQAGLGLAVAGHDGAITLPDAQALPYVVLIGCAGLLAHLCITSALAIAPATVVVPLDFLRLPVIAVLGWMLYGESLDPWIGLGAALILAANYINILNERHIVT
ncbi:MAG: DMT family transporter [Marinibacterium sp.]|nr:DMT family transporter [Marinibacterium sp.]